jgi:hypothetical protein
MRVCRTTLGAILLTLLCGSIIAAHADVPVSGSQGMHRTPAQVMVLQHQAVRGDGDAARQLYWHYGDDGDVAEALRWLRVGARHGDCEAIGMLTESASSTRQRHYWIATVRRRRCALTRR